MKNIKIIPLILLATGLMLLASGCNNDDEENVWDKYKTNREVNNAWLERIQARTNADGTPYYKIIVPGWNPGAYVLIHYFNDRSETEGNLQPMSTSTVDVRYEGYLYDGTLFDSSTSNTTYGPGIFRTRLTGNDVISGWTMAVTDMRVLDTAEVIIPYESAYGASVGNAAIPPYSNLRFNIRLQDIVYYEK